MIANLPLLFVAGAPASLATMGIPELERFIPFLVHCSWGHDTAERIRKPPWWLDSVPFSDPFLAPEVVPDDWAERMRSLVKGCYAYHGSEFLLSFSEELSRNRPSSLRYVDNCDCCTTSLHHRKSGKLLVTFRNEHILYDRKPDAGGRKCLMPRRAAAPAAGDSMVEPAATDLYLCDTCDRVLHSLEEAQSHEKICPHRPPSPNMIPPSPDPDPEIDRDSFMRALGLRPPNFGGDELPPSPGRSGPLPQKDPVRARRATLLSRVFCFPFSSEAGRRLYGDRSRPPEATARQRELPDRYCRAPPLGLERPAWMKRLPDRHYPARGHKRKDRRKIRNHTFTGQRGRHVLDLKSQLLYIECRKPRVVVNRITDKEIADYKNRLLLLAEEAARDRLCGDVYSSDNEIEFVSVTVCDSFARKLIVNRPRPPRARTPPEPLVAVGVVDDDVIDLCSDEDESGGRGGGDENLVPSPGPRRAGGSVFIQSMALVATPEVDRPAEPDSMTEAARYRAPAKRKPQLGEPSPISTTCQPKQKLQPLQQLHDNLNSHLITTVISID